TNPHGNPPFGLADLLQLRPQHDAVAGDDQNVVFGVDAAHRHHRACAFVTRDGTYPFTIAPLCAVAFQRCLFAVAIACDHQHVGVIRLHHVHTRDLIAVFQPDCVDTCRRTPHRPHIVLVEANALSALSGDDDVLI